jgi:O-6-methylguanine DNA methyltransferase
MSTFTELVYEYVQTIPLGKVSTYAGVAGAIGKSGSARAVGTALGKNTDFVHIPCHRVVRTDGSMGGYALGIKKKIQILQKEGVDLTKGVVNMETCRFN